MIEIFKVNNFNIIRLLAALQVVIYHGASHLKVEHSNSFFFMILKYFPGVPIFFFISGLLISKSYESSSTLKGYTRNRMLRIFPALIVCTFVAIASVVLTGYFNEKDIGFGRIFVWVAGQVSFFQFYNPEFMRGFGTGVLNGSLWTISVELQFYIIMPILYKIFSLSLPKKIDC